MRSPALSQAMPAARDLRTLRCAVEACLDGAGGLDEVLTAAESLLRAARARPRGPVVRPTLRIRVLGRFSVEREGLPVPAAIHAPARPRALLQLIVAWGGREVTVERLAEALWPDSDGDVAHHALETTLYRLRRLLVPGALLQRGGRISIDPERCTVDALDLERLLGAPATPLAMERAAALYGAPLLDGESAPWAVGARERLRRRLARWLGDAPPEIRAPWLARLSDADPLLLGGDAQPHAGERGDASCG